MPLSVFTAIDVSADL